jgi:hypothetical protein
MLDGFVLGGKTFEEQIVSMIWVGFALPTAGAAIKRSNRSRSFTLC